MDSHSYDNPNPLKSGQPATVVDIIIPARDEQDVIGRCLQSLVTQRGIAFQITVVDDGSKDGTGEIARSFAGIRVIRAEEPATGISGKSNALIQGARHATAPWLLFADADTEHLPGSLAAAVAEAEERGVDLLSYSPEQEAVTWSERILMPVVFAELARAYPPRRVSDPADPIAAANGQYILVRRRVYEALGGHRVVSNNILEDVALARFFKASDKKIWFRQGQGLVRARMYRSFSSLLEGWSKNLAMLFPNPVGLAVQRGIEFMAIAGLLVIAAVFLTKGSPRLGLAALLTSVAFYSGFLWRVQRAHFSWASNFISFFGLPLFSWLLVRSWRLLRAGAVRWKGRTYAHFVTPEGVGSSIPKSSELEHR